MPGGAAAETLRPGSSCLCGRTPLDPRAAAISLPLVPVPVLVLVLVRSRRLIPCRRQPALLSSSPFEEEGLPQREVGILGFTRLAVAPQYDAVLRDEPGRTIALGPVVVRLRPAVAGAQVPAQMQQVISMTPA